MNNIILSTRNIDDFISDVADEVLRKIEQRKIISHPSSEPIDQLFTIEEAAAFLHLSKATIYSKVSKGELPVMKRSKRLYFSRSELIDYLKVGRRKTHLEILEDANKYLRKKK